MYAVIETGGKQYRVAQGDTLDIEQLDTATGQTLTLDRVLLIGADGKTTVGTPTVAGATVTASVVDHHRGPKKIAFKMKRRKGYHRKVGHRQELIRIKISEIKA
jgi:large subunit ribosomal protein L21